MTCSVHITANPDRVHVWLPQPSARNESDAAAFGLTAVPLFGHSPFSRSLFSPRIGLKIVIYPTSYVLKGIIRSPSSFKSQIMNNLDSNDVHFSVNRKARSSPVLAPNYRFFAPNRHPHYWVFRKYTLGRLHRWTLFPRSAQGYTRRRQKRRKQVSHGTRTFSHLC